MSTDKKFTANYIVAMYSVHEGTGYIHPAPFQTYTEAEAYMVQDMKKTANGWENVDPADVDFCNDGDGTGSVAFDGQMFRWEILPLKAGRVSISETLAALKKNLAEMHMEWMDLVVNGKIVKETADLVDEIGWASYHPCSYAEYDDCAICVRKDENGSNITAIVSGSRNSTDSRFDIFFLDAYDIQELFEVDEDEQENFEAWLNTKTLEDAKAEAESKIRNQLLEKIERLENLIPRYFH